jgi:cyanophycinase-like exopeptidase
MGGQGVAICGRAFILRDAFPLIHLQANRFDKTNQPGIHMPPKKGKIVLMGSGEMTATMVEVHKGLLGQLSGSPQAAFLDTPAGFQLNVNQISQKAVEYFRVHVQHTLSIASFKSHETTTDFDTQQAFHILRNSDYILIGPGSPTYAVRQWKVSPVPEILTQCVTNGGCLVAASAAALTVGRFTLPVYEIYKVGQDLHWVDGMDIFGQFGFNLVVIPHWNNAEGGTHDTRFCFMGEPRFRRLESLLPENVPVFGLDEHTACILDFENKEAEVEGIGRVTLRTSDGELSFKTGDRFPLEILHGKNVDPGWRPDRTKTRSQQEVSEASFQNGLEKHDPKQSTNALLELDRTIWQAQQDLESEEFISQARDTLRDLIVLTGTELASSPGNQAECLAPLVDALLELRQKYRAGKQWTEADAIRDTLQSVNITVEDVKAGSRWRLEV